MALEVYVYYVPRAKLAQVESTGSAPGDGSVVIVTGDTVVWNTPPRFKPLPVTVQFSGALPEATAGVEFTDVETPPSWRYRPFPRPWQPQPAFFAPPGDDSVAPAPEYSQGRVNRDDFRNPYNPRYAIGFALNHPAYDDSVGTPTQADAPGSIPRTFFQEPYIAWGYIGSPAMDDSLDLDHFTRPVGKPPFRERYDPRRALEFAFNISYDDTEVVAAQPDQQGAITLRLFRQPYDSRRAAAKFSGTAAYDDSLVIAAQEGKEAQGSVVRNLHQVMFDSRRAAVKFSGIESHDDSTAVPELTGGVYVPTLRRRRR